MTEVSCPPLTNNNDERLALDEGCANMISEIASNGDTFNVEENVPSAKFPLQMVIDSA